MNEVAVNHALAECGVLIVVVTQTRWQRLCPARLQYFHAREKPIILFRHEEHVNPPTELRRMPIVVFDPRDPDGSYMEVVAEVIRLHS
jgi:hypothetical protein